MCLHIADYVSLWSFCTVTDRKEFVTSEDLLAACLLRHQSVCQSVTFYKAYPSLCCIFRPLLLQNDLSYDKAMI